jgi:hypothetical protein
LRVLLPPPHPANARVSNNAEASGMIAARHRLATGRLRRPMAQAIATRAKASVNRPFSPGDRGGTGRSGRERGTLLAGAVVVTVTVTFAAELPGISVLGENAQVAPEGALAHAKVTLWLNPPWPATLRVYVADCPGATLAVKVEPEATVSVKSCPVPLRLMVCVLPATPLLLSVMVSVPEREPPAEGVNVTLMLHEAPGATLLPQSLVCLKLALVAMLLTVSAASPLLLSVTACAALAVFASCPPKVRPVCETSATGAVPVPARLTVCVLPGA